MTRDPGPDFRWLQRLNRCEALRDSTCLTWVSRIPKREHNRTAGAHRLQEDFHPFPCNISEKGVWRPEPSAKSGDDCLVSPVVPRLSIGSQKVHQTSMVSPVAFRSTMSHLFTPLAKRMSEAFGHPCRAGHGWVPWIGWLNFAAPGAIAGRNPTQPTKLPVVA